MSSTGLQLLQCGLFLALSVVEFPRSADVDLFHEFPGPSSSFPVVALLAAIDTLLLIRIRKCERAAIPDTELSVSTDA